MAITDNKSQQQATKTNITTTLNEDQVKRMMQEAKLEIIQQLKEEKPDKKQETGVSGGQGPTTETTHFGGTLVTSSGLALLHFQ
jgi:hypothetical protein